MSAEPDFIVVGSGHNGLVTAAYLAAAGKRVHVVERQEWFGGGVVTKELTRPGFKHELHSLGHVLIQANPLIANDELGLVEKYGLKYKKAKVTSAATFDDGSALLIHSDRERTRDAIAKFSPRDAEAYVKLAELSERIMAMVTPGWFVPPEPMGQMMAMLDSTPEGQALITMMGKSFDTIINEWFEDDRVRFAFIRTCCEIIITYPETKGVGLIVPASVHFIERYGYQLAEGGNSGLTNSLIACIEDHGGSVVGGVDVSKVIVRNGRAVGIKTTDGDEITAKDAVVGMFHPHHIDRYFDDLDPQLVRAAHAFELSDYTGFVIQAALNEPLRYHAGQEASDAVFNEIGTPSLRDMYDGFAEIRRGDLPSKFLFGTSCPSATDPTRAPDGKSLLALFAHVPYSLRDGGPGAWETVKEDYADRLMARLGEFTENLDGNVIDRFIVTPTDHEKHTLSFTGGDIHGGAPLAYQSGSYRPIPQLSQYMIPGISNFYLSGPFMHPGGGVTGGGRGTAIKMAADLGFELPVT